MTIKSSQTLVSEALSEVKTITADEALKLSNDGACTLIDIREKDELDKTGRVESSNHIPRGMLEFWFCLLYTSPSPRDGLLSRMPSSA